MKKFAGFAPLSLFNLALYIHQILMIYNRVEWGYLGRHQPGVPPPHQFNHNIIHRLL